MTNVFILPALLNTINLSQGAGVLRRTDVNFNYPNLNTKDCALSHQGYRATDLTSSDGKFYAPCNLKRVFKGAINDYAGAAIVAIFETVSPVKCADNIIRDVTLVCLHGGNNIPDTTGFIKGDHFYTQGVDGLSTVGGTGAHMHIEFIAGKLTDNAGNFNVNKFLSMIGKFFQGKDLNKWVNGVKPEYSLNIDDICAIQSGQAMKYTTEAQSVFAPYFNFKTESEVANCTTNGWIKEYGVWYLYKDGVKQTGWKADQGCWYFLDYVNGRMHEGWVADGPKWYFCNPANGIMQYGWVKVDGQYYYLDPDDGGAMVTGYIIYSGKTYLFDSSGALKGTPPNINIPSYTL